MTTALDIAEVARRTGLTSRALRFYEARGLVAPLRTASGRRIFGPDELTRIHQLLALKRAGLSLAQIKQLFDGRSVDFERLLRAQIETIDAQVRELGAARAHLNAALSRVDRGEPLDAETLCSLIRDGESIMTADNWMAIADRYFTPDEQAEWRERMAKVGEAFDQDAYGEKWKALGARIEAAKPMAADSAEAQAFVDEWFALLKPFTDVATPAMWNGTVRMYDDMESWEGQGDPGFSKAVWDFMKLATASRMAAGGAIEGLPRRENDR